MIRDGVLTFTILAVIYILDHQPRPVQSAQADYCLIDQHTAAKALGIYPDGSPALDEQGKQRWRWQFSWEKVYGLCALQDKFFFI